jgi:hypothetical protein
MDQISSAGTEFVVITAAACMPNSCWGTYRRVAVLEVVRGVTPKMISARARGVVRVICTWERRNVGKTDRCAYSRAVAEAVEMVDELNERTGARGWTGAALAA